MKVSNIVLFSSVILLPVLYCDVPNNEEGNLKEEAPSRIVGSGRKHTSATGTEDLDEINLSREPATNEKAKLPQLEPDGVNNTELEEQKNNASVEKNPFPPPNAPLSSPHEAHGGMNEDAKLPEIASNSSNNSNQKGNSLPIDTFSGHNDKSEGEIHDKNNEFSNSKNDKKEDRKIMSQSELQDDGVNNLSREALTNTEAEKDKNAKESHSQVESEHPLETQPTHTESKPQDKITNNKTEESPKSSKIGKENSDLPNSTKNGIKNFNNVRKKLTQIFKKFKRKKPKINQTEDGQKEDAKINNSNNEGMKADPENNTFSELPQKSNSVGRENLVNAESSENPPMNKGQPPQEDEVNEESSAASKNEDGDDTQGADNAEKGDTKINNSNEEVNASPENDTFSKLSQEPENVNAGENFNNKKNIESSETLSTNKSQLPQEDEINEESPTINKNEDGDDTPSAENAEKGDTKINNSSNEGINASPENDTFSKLSQESDNVDGENFNNTNIESSETLSTNKNQPLQEDEFNEESPTVNKNEDSDDTPSADNAEKEDAKINNSSERNASPENDTFSKLSQKPDNVSGENFNNTNIESSETSPLNGSQLPQENEINKESPGVSESENGDDNPSADNADKEDATINDHSNEVNSNPENNTISETPPKSKNVDEKNLSNTNIKSSETPPKSKSQPLWEDEISEESPTVDENDDVDNLSANNATPEENFQNKGTDILSKSLSNKNETNDNESGDIMSKEKENIAGEDDPKNAPAKGIPEENSGIQTRSSIGENGNENNSTLNQSDNLEEIEDETDEDPTDEEIETENNDEENLSNNFTPDEDIYEELLPKINTETNSKIQSEKNSDDEIESKENLSVFDDVHETDDDDGDSQEADEMPKGNEETKSEEVDDKNEDNYLEPPHAFKENDSKYLDNGNNDPKMKESQEVNKKTITNEIEPANSDSKVQHLDEDSSLVGSLKGKEDEDRVSEELASEKDTKISNRDVGEEQPLQIENNLNGVLQNGTRNIKPEHENNNSLPLDTLESEPTEKYDNDQDENPTVISPEMDESRENKTEDLNASNEEEQPKVMVGNTSNNTESGTTLDTSKTDNEMRSEEISEQIDSSESSETSSSNKQENNTPIIKQQIKISPFIYKSIFVSYFSPALQRHLTNRMQITKAQRPPTNNNEALQKTVNGTPSPKPDSELNTDMNNSIQNDSMSSSNENDSVELGTWNRALLKDDDDDFSQEESKYLPSESNENTEKDHIPEPPITTSLPSVIQSRSNSSLKEGNLSGADTKVVPEEMNRANLPINEETNSAEISNTSDADPSTVEELPQNFTQNKVKRNQLLPKIQEKPKRDSSNKDTPATPEKTNKNNLSLEEMIDDPIESSETVDEDSPLFGESPKNIPKNRPKPKEKILPSNPQRKSPANAHNPCKKSPKQFPLKNKSQPQLPSGSYNAPSTSDLVPKNINSTGPSDENKPPEESEKSEELGQPTWETEENDSQANDDNYPEEIIGNELSKEDDESPPETQKKTQSAEPNFMRPVTPSIPSRRKNNILRKKKSKIARPQLPSRSNNAPSTSDLVPKNTDSTSPSDENKPPKEFEKSEELGQPTVEMEENDSQANDNNYPEEVIENELSKEDDESPPETQKKTQSAEPNSVRPVSPSIPPQRKNNFPQKKKTKIPKSKSSNSENKPLAREFVYRATPNKFQEAGKTKEPNLPTSKLRSENPQATNDDSYEDDLPEDDSPENASPPNENMSKDTPKNATNTFPSDNNVYLREMPEPDSEEMSVETRDNEPENTTPKNDSPQTETTEDESESETSSTEGGNELPAINGGNNPVKFNPLQGMAVNPFSSYFPPVFSPFMRSFNQPPMARQTNEGTASVPPARISNPPPTPPQPSNEEDDITKEEPSSEVESLENRDEEDPIISDHDNVEQKPEPANVPPPVYKSMTVSFLSPTTSKQQPIVRSSSYFSMGTGDNPFWSAMQRIVGIGVKNAGALIEGAGKVSEAGFDATKDVFDMVKKVPVVRDVISPVKKFAENGLDVADQTVTGSLLSIGSYVNDQGQTTRARSLGQLAPDRYRYRYRYPNSDESNNDSAAEKQQSAPSSLWSFGKFAMNGPTTQNTQGRSLNNPMPYYSRYRYSNNWK